MQDYVQKLLAPLLCLLCQRCCILVPTAAGQQRLCAQGCEVAMYLLGRLQKVAMLVIQAKLNCSWNLTRSAPLRVSRFLASMNSLLGLL